MLAVIDRTRKLFDTKVVGRELANQYMCAGHPNIVQLREVFLTDTHLAVVVEYANGGDLAHYTDALMRHTVRHSVLTAPCWTPTSQRGTEPASAVTATWFST